MESVVVRSSSPVDFSPPLIVMVVMAAAAFLAVTYSRLISRHLFPPLLRLFRKYRRWRLRRRLLRRPRLPSSFSDIDSPPYSPSNGFYVYSPYGLGLDESVIKAMPLSIYTTAKTPAKLITAYPGIPVVDKVGHTDCCAVCLLEFEENDYVRTLPLCSHSFHVDCIDVWLLSHASCPLCRAGILPPTRSPFVPMMAARIRPSSLDEGMMLEHMFLVPQPPAAAPATGEIEVEVEVEPVAPPETRDQPCLLKRSYSFGFERNFPSERLVLEAAMTASPPWRYHHRRRKSGLLWRRAASPFNSLSKSRVFSFRNYSNRGMKSSSPFLFRRRGSLLAPMSSEESPSRRRSKSMTSPMFGRLMMFSSSRLRCGDPEALLSPHRYAGRR